MLAAQDVEAKALKAWGSVWIGARDAVPIVEWFRAGLEPFVLGSWDTSQLFFAVASCCHRDSNGHRLGMVRG